MIRALVISTSRLRSSVGAVELGRHRRAQAAQVLAERERRLTRRADGDELAVVEHRGAVADPAHEVDRVGHEQDRAALASGTA